MRYKDKSRTVGQTTQADKLCYRSSNIQIEKYIDGLTIYVADKTTYE